MTIPSANKPIVFTGHALERMGSRRIKEAQVVNTIREPHFVAAGKTDHTRSFERDFPPAKRLTVIAEETDAEFVVITVYWE